MTHINVKFTIKLVRPFNPSTISFDDGDNYVTVTLGDEVNPHVQISVHISEQITDSSSERLRL